jgi:tRNA(Arg) A34 adenosine deaminase TadA
MKMEKRDDFMKEAIELARKNATSITGGPFGALIVKDGKIVASRTNSVTPDKDPTAHAEVNAIREACKKLDTFDLSGCTLYTSCEPCPMCLSAAYWAKVDKIYFAAGRDDAADAGFSDSFIYDEFTKSMKDRNIPIEQILPTEGKKPFDLWKNNDKKIPY